MAKVVKTEHCTFIVPFLFGVKTALPPTSDHSIFYVGFDSKKWNRSRDITQNIKEKLVLFLEKSVSLTHEMFIFTLKHGDSRRK